MSIVPRGRGGRQSMSSARTGQTMSPNLRQKNGRGRAKDTRVPRAARRSKSGSALAAVATRAAQLSVRVLTRVRRARHFKVPLSVRGGQGEQKEGGGCAEPSAGAVAFAVRWPPSLRSIDLRSLVRVPTVHPPRSTRCFHCARSS